MIGEKIEELKMNWFWVLVDKMLGLERSGRSNMWLEEYNLAC